MAGRHSKRGARTRIARVIAVPRRPGIEVVDALTSVAHRVSSAALLAGSRSGQYQALCGTRLLSASLTDPGRGRCAACAR